MKEQRLIWIFNWKNGYTSSSRESSNFCRGRKNRLPLKADEGFAVWNPQQLFSRRASLWAIHSSMRETWSSLTHLVCLRNGWVVVHCGPSLSPQACSSIIPYLLSPQCTNHDAESSRFLGKHMYINIVLCCYWDKKRHCIYSLSTISITPTSRHIPPPCWLHNLCMKRTV